ncbi:MAG TPA: hypothetical protein VIZ43_29365 [Trebonia sp.]
MTRWSLRRHLHRAQRPVTGTYRLDPVQPELESATATGCRPDASASGAAYAANGYAPGDYPRDAYRADAYQPDTAAGHTMTQPGAARAAQEATPEPTPSHAASGAWPEVMEQFGLHLAVLAEQLRISLDELKADEADPERLQKLYLVDHAVTRMRRASSDLRTPAGREQEELSGIDTSLLDVIRMALSAIERYTHEDSGIGMEPDGIPGEDLDRPQAPPPVPRTTRAACPCGPPSGGPRSRRPAPPKPRGAASSPGPAMISVPALTPVPAATARSPGDHPRSRPRPGGPSPRTSPHPR